jgi:pimeloyl-ACP methyl ester carboxylesterase
MPPTATLTNLRRRIGLLLVLLLFGAVVGAGPASADGDEPDAPKPTIVLVHGAWADSSGFDRVVRNLHADGYEVIAVANPLRGLTTDSEYLASVLATIEGPIVIAGHSYGGVVMTNAATGNPNVKALVYIAGFAPDEGDTVGGLLAINPGSLIGPDTLVIRPYPGGVDTYIAADIFHEAVAADLSVETAAMMAATQRPVDPRILDEDSGPPAWAEIPSWYPVATEDNTLPPATQRFMAERAGATVMEVESSHVAMTSQPGRTTYLIEAAVEATS